MLLKWESFVDESFVDESFIFKESSSTLAEFIDPDWGVKVNSGIGLSYRHARLHGLTGRYDNPMPELTISSSHGSMNSSTVQQNIHWTFM
jgi:hypothetical protein